MLLLRLEVGCAELCPESFKVRNILNFYAFRVLSDQQFRSLRDEKTVCPRTFVTITYHHAALIVLLGTPTAFYLQCYGVDVSIVHSPMHRTLADFPNVCFWVFLGTPVSFNRCINSTHSKAQAYRRCSNSILHTEYCLNLLPKFHGPMRIFSKHIHKTVTKLFWSIMITLECTRGTTASTHMPDGSRS